MQTMSNQRIRQRRQYGIYMLRRQNRGKPCILETWSLRSKQFLGNYRLFMKMKKLMAKRATCALALPVILVFCTDLR